MPAPLFCLPVLHREMGPATPCDVGPDWANTPARVPPPPDVAGSDRCYNSLITINRHPHYSDRPAAQKARQTVNSNFYLLEQLSRQIQNDRRRSAAALRLASLARVARLVRRAVKGTAPALQPA